MGLQPFESGAFTRQCEVWECDWRKRGESNECSVGMSEEVTARMIERVNFAVIDVLTVDGNEGSVISWPDGSSKMGDETGISSLREVHWNKKSD